MLIRMRNSFAHGLVMVYLMDLTNCNNLTKYYDHE